ncbi:capsular biosynthesis protein [Lysinibacillus sp. 2017]|uniref:capsular polysaccharide biosynthesis protein CapF n=1 Tax=unclassified Lysinibacillus TaxID=2636778 RepID=UPI000D528304|nr:MULTISPECIES: capsular polysaccharide biosynthesis protein CapF [unclassified Lysinibacillus]AWE06757.1 capsular biosynthesis protein [Lysinibacillus sp. 2017]TGN37311.1 capsular polysaccharide biosynthesis protein CapF [Lysinibacillus sp. S2017]
MKILVTGAKGFIGKNLIVELKNRGFSQIYEFTRDSDPALLENYANECDFVFHLAGVNRPQSENDFMEGNYEFTSQLLELLKKSRKKAPFVTTSSIQAELDNPYGNSKKAMEDLVFQYQEETGAKVYVYRLPNVFGKWSKPNYNSVVSTYCYNIARNLDIQINNPDAKLTLCYIDDVIEEFLRTISGLPTVHGDYYVVPTTHIITLSELANLITNFRDSRMNLEILNMEDALTKKLYSTYLSFLPIDQFAYDLRMNLDSRGSFTEFIRTPDRGQVSVNVSKPGITKGNHWHHTKNEKFLVVSGEGLIRFRKLDSNDIIEYRVNGEKLQVVDIPTGYTHSIVNVGNTDLVTVMWVNECFDPVKPDTFYLEV